MPRAKVRPADVPAYPLREATRLTGISFGALWAWSHGRSPIIRLEGAPFWSFTNIVEAYALRSLRQAHMVKLDAVRKAVRYVERHIGMEHPLATSVFRTDGVDLFVEHFGSLINASQAGQVAIREALEKRLRNIDYDKQGRAARLYMDGDRRLIVIDPAVGFGRPIVAGTSVPVDAIVERFVLGESPRSLAEDFGIEQEHVDEAIRTRVAAHAAA